MTVGYNWQRSCGTLFGVEADWSWGKLSATIADNPNGGGLTIDKMTGSIQNYGTQRTRTGLVIDNLLLYLTGGLAIATIDFEGRDTSIPFSFSDTRWGWTAGVGTEWALGRNLTFKSEILYISFEDKHHSFVTPGGTRFDFTTEDSMWVGRAGINYKFLSRAAAQLEARTRAVRAFSLLEIVRIDLVDAASRRARAAGCCRGTAGPSGRARRCPRTRCATSAARADGPTSGCPGRQRLLVEHVEDCRCQRAGIECRQHGRIVDQRAARDIDQRRALLDGPEEPASRPCRASRR